MSVSRDVIIYFKIVKKNSGNNSITLQYIEKKHFK